MNNNIIQAAYNMSKEIYVPNKYYKFVITDENVKDLAKQFKCSEEYIHSIVLATSNLRVE